MPDPKPPTLDYSPPGRRRWPVRPSAAGRVLYWAVLGLGCVALWLLYELQAAPHSVPPSQGGSLLDDGIIRGLRIAMVVIASVLIAMVLIGSATAAERRRDRSGER